MVLHLKDLVHSSHSALTSRYDAPAVPFPGFPPSIADIYKTRLHVGVNLGGWFILEKWIAPYMYSAVPDGADDSEYTAVTSTIQKLGAEEARKKWESHYDSFITREDFKWLADHHVSSVRVPLGYWIIAGGGFVSGTPFDDQGVAYVYRNAWGHFTNMLRTAAEFGIGVLIDLHGVPGGANPDSHSGVCKGGNFFDTDAYIELAVGAVEYIANEAKNFANVIGIQLVNEASWDAKMDKYYCSAAAAIRRVDRTQRVYISDAWDRPRYQEFVKGKSGLLVDTHIYRCFTADASKKSPAQHVEEAKNESNLDTNTIVGEFSCTLPGDSWSQVTEGDRSRLRQQYGHAQVELYSRTTAGFFFWTYKFAEGRGGEWDLREMVDTGCIPLPARTGRRPTDGSRECQDTTQGHVSYWNGAARGESMEHWRFEEGFRTGWMDSYKYWEMDESVIGQIDFLKSARLQQHIDSRGQSQYVWEFEHGFSAGVSVFRRSVER
ncbi:glycoside hydrolase superfamily [Limtongia smithiae]|uniref:glycoside hydrolase superfamily n=1 Tax=Limtongia smithiae TaxID=1125753 RepID=UPI0034CE2254